MRRRGDRVKIISGKYAGHTGTVESNVYQRTVDYPDEWANGHYVMLDTEELVTVRWEQVEAEVNETLGRDTTRMAISLLSLTAHRRWPNECKPELWRCLSGLVISALAEGRHPSVADGWRSCAEGCGA